MGYYDFDEHFWSPREVCAQAAKAETQVGFFSLSKLVRLVFSGIFRSADGVATKVQDTSH